LTWAVAVFLPAAAFGSSPAAVRRVEVWASESLYFSEQIPFDAILKKIQK
jgi:hypothetical protein